MIVVTPYLVRPVSGRIALPTDGYRAPTDAERILEGQSYSGQRALRRRSPARLPACRRRCGDRRRSGLQAVTRRCIGRMPRCVRSSSLCSLAMRRSPGCALPPGTSPTAGVEASTCRSDPLGLCRSTRPLRAASFRRRKLRAWTPGSAASILATAIPSTSTAPTPTPRAPRLPQLPASTACWSHPGAPVTAGAVPSGQRSRRRQPHASPRFRTARTGAARRSRTYNNRSMPDFGCARERRSRREWSPILRISSTAVKARASVDAATGSEGGQRLPHAARRPARRASRTSAPRRATSNERSVPGTRRSARSVHGLRLRRCDRRHASAGCGRAWLVAREGQQGRAAQCGPVAVGLGEPEHPVRGSVANRPTR